LTILNAQCGSCGETIGESKFCLHCGKSQYCTACETKFESNEKFCGKCGTKRGGPTNNVVDEKNLDVQVSPQQSVQSHQQKKSFDMKKIPWFIWVIGVGAIIFIVYTFSDDGPITPEKAIENFFVAVEKKDMKDAQKYIHPYSEDLIDFTEMPFDLSIKVLHYDEVEIEEDEAYVTAIVNMSSKAMDESFTEEMYIELEKMQNKWIIYDIY